jgi:hypothetical protein
VAPVARQVDIIEHEKNRQWKARARARLRTCCTGHAGCCAGARAVALAPRGLPRRHGASVR